MSTDVPKANVPLNSREVFAVISPEGETTVSRAHAVENWEIQWGGDRRCRVRSKCDLRADSRKNSARKEERRVLHHFTTFFVDTLWNDLVVN